jgi:hypothetical protein
MSPLCPEQSQDFNKGWTPGCVYLGMCTSVCIVYIHVYIYKYYINLYSIYSVGYIYNSHATGVQEADYTEEIHVTSIPHTPPLHSLTTLNACLYCNGHNWKLRSWHFLYYLILLNHCIYWLDNIGGDPWSIAGSTRSEKLWVPKTPGPKIPSHSFAI